MKQVISTLLMVVCGVAFIGCEDGPVPPKQPASAEPHATEPKVPEPNTVEPNVPSPTEIPAVLPADAFEITGTVSHKNFEGGFFAIDADDGKRYDPISLPEQFRKDGLKVKVTARLKPNAVSFHMYGSIIEILDITTR